MDVIGHDREGDKIDSKVSSLAFELFFDPILAVIEVLIGEWVVSQKEAPAYHTCHDMEYSNLGWIEDFSSSQPRHDGISTRSRNQPTFL